MVEYFEYGRRRIDIRTQVLQTLDFVQAKLFYVDWRF